MKCPHCGHWNKASLPRCFNCGEPLPAQADYERSQDPAWRHDLHEDAAPKVYIRVDEDGQATSEADVRDSLAQEMVELKARKARGEMHQRKLREESSRRGYAPSSMTVRTNTTRETVFRVKDDPQTALRPMPPELVENDGAEEGATPVYNTARFSRTGRQESAAEGADILAFGASDTARWAPLPSNDAAASQSVYDGFNDSQSYEPLWEDVPPPEYVTPHSQRRQPMSRRTGRSKLMRVLFFLSVAAVVVLFGYVAMSQWQQVKAQEKLARKPTVVASIVNDLAAHTITIPGDDGQQIYVRELSNSYVVSGGVAVIEIPDYIWYNDYEDYLSDTMDVSLTPYLRTSSGALQPMDPVPYQIDIPLSPIELITPDIDWVEVSTAMYSMRFRVREDSTVTINGSDYSDLVNQEGGDVTYNATVQPIGENKVTIKVRTQYCRENTVVITLYRAVQEIPLDLVSNQSTTSSEKTMKVTAATIPGAIVNVLTPHTDLEITKTATDGTFSFIAVFNKIGDNTVTIQAEYQGRQPSVLNFTVYYVPPANDYTRKAWPMDATNYAELLSNNAQRVKSAQIYLCEGIVTQIISNKPQLAILNTGTETSPQYVMLENSTKTTWVEGTAYKIFADAFGIYNDMPRLVARYTYKK